jgi:hypothetical protein
MPGLVVKSRCKNRSINQQNLSNLFHHRVFLIQIHTFNYIRPCWIKKITTNVSNCSLKSLKFEEFDSLTFEKFLFPQSLEIQLIVRECSAKNNVQWKEDILFSTIHSGMFFVKL